MVTLGAVNIPAKGFEWPWLTAYYGGNQVG